MPPTFCIGALLQPSHIWATTKRHESNSANTPHFICFVSNDGGRRSFHLCDNNVCLSTERFCHLFEIVSRYTGFVHGVLSDGHSFSLLMWRPLYYILIVLFPLAALGVDVAVVLLLDAAQPSNDFHCDATHPIWYVGCLARFVILSDIPPRVRFVGTFCFVLPVYPPFDGEG
jgi:hypothetical protein